MNNVNGEKIFLFLFMFKIYVPTINNPSPETSNIFNDSFRNINAIIATIAGERFISGSELLMSNFFSATITEKKAIALNIDFTNKTASACQVICAMSNANRNGIANIKENTETKNENSNGSTLNRDFFSAIAAIAESIAEINAKTNQSMQLNDLGI